MRYEGNIYRPPSEARSLIIQVTVGCSHNRCTFCNMYKDKKFRIRHKEEVLLDLDEMSEIYGELPLRIFLADGDALVLKTEDLLDILRYIKIKFPFCQRITAYATVQDILRMSWQADTFPAPRGASSSHIHMSSRQQKHPGFSRDPGTSAVAAGKCSFCRSHIHFSQKGSPFCTDTGKRTSHIPRETVVCYGFGKSCVQRFSKWCPPCHGRYYRSKNLRSSDL